MAILASISEEKKFCKINGGESHVKWVWNQFCGSLLTLISKKKKLYWHCWRWTTNCRSIHVQFAAQQDWRLLWPWHIVHGLVFEWLQECEGPEGASNSQRFAFFKDSTKKPHQLSNFWSISGKQVWKHFKQIPWRMIKSHTYPPLQKRPHISFEVVENSQGFSSKVQKKAIFW